MRPTLRALIGFSAIGLAALAVADGFDLKRIPQTGSAIKYTMSVEFLANGGKGTISATLLEQIADVDKDGNFTVQQTQIDATGTFEGENFDIPARSPISMTYKPNRLLSKIQGDLIDVNSYRVENLATIVAPEKPVNVGDEWLGEIKEDKALGTRPVKFEYKLVGEEKVADVDTLKIKASGREADGQNPAQHDFTMWISKTDGAMIQLESKWTNAPFPGISSPVSATIKITKAAS
jgi:hypothetical protein